MRGLFFVEGVAEIGPFIGNDFFCRWFYGSGFIGKRWFE